MNKKTALNNPKLLLIGIPLLIIILISLLLVMFVQAQVDPWTAYYYDWEDSGGDANWTASIGMSRTDDYSAGGGTWSAFFPGAESDGLYYMTVDIDGSAYTAYISGGEARKKATTITGLTHLVGEEVSILSEGAFLFSFSFSNSFFCGGGISLNASPVL